MAQTPVSATDPVEVVLLEDAPTNTDSFGAHSRVATAIAELIKSDTPGGKVLGLEGGWGTGKTTVTRLLSQQLSDSKHHGFVMFDTWAHEGDPLRRTFLERMISALIGLEWVDEERWKERLDELACRRKEITKKTVPKPTTLGKWFALSVLSVPFGSALLSDALRDGAEYAIDGARPFSFQLLAGTTLTLSWAVVLLLNFARVGFQKVGGTRTRDSWDFLLSKSTTEETTSSVETPEPTSVEFDRYFSELLHEALIGHKSRRLTLVLDNLDRVDADHALALWATLQTFLQDRSHAESAWFDQLWVLVPYDPSGVSRLWAQEEGASERASVSFLDKVFAIRFRVPQLLLADWRDYLLDQAESAFPQLSATDRRRLLSVFEIHRSDHPDPATPRSIKVYLNQVGSILRQWGQAFPLAHVGYYALLSERDDIADALRDGRIPGGAYKHALGISATDSLAGLHFNVAPQDGQQLLLSEPVISAIRRQDGAELESLAENHKQRFYAVLGNVVAVQLTREGGRANCRAARSIQDASLDLGNPELVLAIELIASAIEDEAEWGLLDSECAIGIGSLLRLVSDANRSKRIVKRVSQNLPKTPEQTEGDKEGSVAAHVSAWLSILQVASELNHDAASKIGIIVPCDGSGWTSACKVLTDEDPTGEYVSAFAPSLTSTQLARYFQRVVDAGSFDTSSFGALRISAARNWKAVLSSVRERLNASGGAEPEEAGALLDALLHLRQLKVPEDPAQAAAFNAGGHYLHHLHSAETSNNDRMRAACILLSLTASPGGAAPGAIGNSAGGHALLMKGLSESSASFLEELTGLTIAYSSLETLLSVREARGEWDHLIKALLHAIAQHDQASRFFTSEALVEHWWVLMPALNERPNGARELVAHLDEDRVLSKVVRQTTLPEGASASIAYYLLSTGLAEQDFVDWCCRGLESLDADSWFEALQGKKRWSALLLIELDKLGRPVKLRSKYVDAHAKLAEGILSGDVSELKYLDRWPVLLEPLGNEGLRRGLRGKLLQATYLRDGELPELFLSAYGPELAQHSSLATEDAVNRLFAPLVKASTATGNRWLCELLRARPDVLDICRDPALAEMLHSRILDALKESVPEESGDEGEELDVLQEVAEMLGISPAQNDLEIDKDEGS